ncbi:60Kd inner membrane protein [Nesidiocoris tenuis]|uniref:60Kd inner membrane protein n=1 Tax=Nesidiocoris tenuis TaxID=355587 RepID=A0ABN7A724_9HEMI|nr:60Kd inner membrane protein [Nesidiocoris tenuis]
MKDSAVFSYLSDCSATEVMRSLAVNVHDWTGLPWWGTVVLMTFSLRAFITFPLAIYQNYVLAKVENLSKLDMPELSEEIKKEVTRQARAEGWNERKASLHYKIRVKKKWDELVIKNNCHPFKATVTLWVQIPTWVFFSVALRNLAYMLPFEDAAAQLTYLQLSVGGLLWIPNLTQPDDTFILPLILGLTNLAIIEMQAVRKISEPTRFQRYILNFFRIFSVALIPLASTVPSILCLYWTTSSILGLGQNLLFLSNRLRAICRIPDTPSSFEHPYRQLWADICYRTSKFYRK